MKSFPKFFSRTAPFFVLLICICQPSFGQLQVNQALTPAQLAGMIAGGGVAISNVTFSGAASAAGSFDNGNSTNIGLNSGVLLTTGNAQLAIGPNNTASAGMENFGGAYPPVANSFDAAILEFDLVPSTNQLTFRFVFGSEEYPEYVTNLYNDGFGILLSGPGIAGNQNIATLPGTATPVNIGNVNAGANSGYYVNNAGGSTIQYDGFTTVITATKTVQACQTYHIQFVVFDELDGIYDSGVFIEEGSLSSGSASVTVNDVTSCGGQSVTLTANTSVSGGSLVWSTGATTQSITVNPSVTTNYTVSFTHGPCNSVYTDIATVTVSPGVNVSITPPSATLCNGQNVQLSGTVTATGSNQQSFSNPASYPITDYDLLFGATITRSPINISGLNFSNITTGSIQSVCININHTFDGDLQIYLESPNGNAMFLSNQNGGAGDNYTNTCFESVGTAITAGGPPYNGVYTPQDPFTTLNGVPANGIWNLAVLDQGFLDVGTILNWSITFGNQITVTGYNWTPATGLSNPNILNPIASPSATTTYTLTGTNSIGCTGSTQVTVTVGGLTVATAATPASCGQSNGTAISSVNGGTPPITYAWSNGANSAIVNGLTAGNYTVTATDGAGCFGISTVTVPVSSLPTGTPGLWTWTGAMSIDWFDPCNWDKLTVPTPADPVLIPGGTSNNPWVNGQTAYCQHRSINHSNGGHLTILRSTGGQMVVGP